MHAISRQFLSVALVCLISDPAQAQETRRDASGTPMHLSAEHSISPAEIVINFGDLTNVNVGSARQRIRDNAVIHQSVYFNDRKGFLSVQYASSNFYNLNVTQSFNDRSQFKNIVTKFTRKASRPDFEVVKLDRLRSFERYGGYIMHIQFPDTVECVFARVGYTTHTNFASATDERYDTLVVFRDCSMRNTYEPALPR